MKHKLTLSRLGDHRYDPMIPVRNKARKWERRVAALQAHPLYSVKLPAVGDPHTPEQRAARRLVASADRCERQASRHRSAAGMPEERTAYKGKRGAMRRLLSSRMMGTALHNTGARRKPTNGEAT